MQLRLQVVWSASPEQETDLHVARDTCPGTCGGYLACGTLAQCSGVTRMVGKQTGRLLHSRPPPRPRRHFTLSG